MLANNDSSSYTSQYSNTTMEPSESESNPSSPLIPTRLQYGPIQVRPYRKSTPTIATGRRSKHLLLAGDEAVKREKRRERNREAAKKLKAKRQLIEDELSRQIQQLENEHSDLENYLQQLQNQKQNLEEQIDNLLNDPKGMDSLDELLSNDNQDMSLYTEQYSDDLDLFDEYITNILNS